MATPRFRVVPKRARSLAAEIIEFGEKHGVHLDGWQQDAVDAFSGIGSREASDIDHERPVRSASERQVDDLRPAALFGLFVLRKQLILFSRTRGPRRTSRSWR